MMRTL